MASDGETVYEYCHRVGLTIRKQDELDKMSGRFVFPDWYKEARETIDKALRKAKTKKVDNNIDGSEVI